MPKLVGIRERVGSVGLVTRDVQGIGFYERSGDAERQYAPYDAVGLGATEPYDLSAPGRVAEIKKVLIELGKFWSDPNRNPSDPQFEETFKHIDTTPAYADAWDGPTADSFALTAGRHTGRFPAFMPAARRKPLIQLPKFQDVHGHDVVVGGPQPTVAGLEAIAQAAHEVLNDTVQLDQYLQWRGGVLDCLSATTETCIPPDSLVKPTPRKGRSWNPRGWTIAWRDGPVAQQNPELTAQLDMIEGSLETSWRAAPLEPNEVRRKERADTLAQLRKQRHDLVLKLNQGAPAPTCPDASMVWDSAQGGCVPRCPPDKKWDSAQEACVVEVSPSVYPSWDACMADQLKAAEEPEARAACDALFPSRLSGKVAAVAIVAGLGVGGYLLFRGATKAPTMTAPE